MHQALVPADMAMFSLHFPIFANFMKLILIFLTISAVFFPDSFPGEDADIDSDSVKAYYHYVSPYYQAAGDNTLIYDVLEEYSDDDVNESDRKKLYSDKSLLHKAYYLVESSNSRSVNKPLHTRYLFTARSSLSVFISVLRI
jgi:hypothetical protein